MLLWLSKVRVEWKRRIRAKAVALRKRIAVRKRCMVPFCSTRVGENADVNMRVSLIYLHFLSFPPTLHLAQILLSAFGINCTFPPIVTAENDTLYHPSKWSLMRLYMSN